MTEANRVAARLLPKKWREANAPNLADLRSRVHMLSQLLIDAHPGLSVWRESYEHAASNVLAFFGVEAALEQRVAEIVQQRDRQWAIECAKLNIAARATYGGNITLEAALQGQGVAGFEEAVETIIAMLGSVYSQHGTAHPGEETSKQIEDVIRNAATALGSDRERLVAENERLRALLENIYQELGVYAGDAWPVSMETYKAICELRAAATQRGRG